MTKRSDLSDIENLVRRSLSRAHQGLVPAASVLEAARLSRHPQSIATALISEGTYLVVSHQFASVQPVIEEVRAILEAEAIRLPSRVEWSWLNIRARYAAQSLDLDTAVRLLKRALALDEPVSAPRQTIALLQLGRCFMRQDRLGDAVETFAMLRHQNSDLNMAGLLVEGHLAELFQNHDHWARSRIHLQNTLAPGAFDQPMARAFFGSQLVATLVELDEVDEARHVALDVKQSAVATGWAFSLAIAGLAESQVALASGDTKGSLVLVDSALSLMRRTGNQYEELGALLHKAKVLLAAGEYDLAEAAVDDSRIDLMGPLFARKVVQLRADCCRAQGRWAEVVKHQAVVRELNDSYSVRFPDLYSMLLERHRLDEAGKRRLLLDSANARLRAAQAEKDELSAIVAHDLKSPLTALGLTLEFLSLQTNEEQAKVRLATASETVARVRQITDQLSAVKQIDAGAIEFTIEPVRIGPVIERVVRQFGSTAQAKNIALSVGSCAERWEQLIVCADIVRLEQVLDNLVSNALKYSPRGSRVTLECQFRNQGVGIDIEFVQIAVVDEGLGLSDGDLSGLFQKYGRLSSRPTGDESSSGVGLYIAQSFATSMGGEIGATSPGKGAGSTFVLSLPAAEGQTAHV